MGRHLLLGRTPGLDRDEGYDGRHRRRLCGRGLPRHGRSMVFERQVQDEGVLHRGPGSGSAPGADPVGLGECRRQVHQPRRRGHRGNHPVSAGHHHQAESLDRARFGRKQSGDNREELLRGVWARRREVRRAQCRELHPRLVDADNRGRAVSYRGQGPGAGIRFDRLQPGHRGKRLHVPACRAPHRHLSLARQRVHHRRRHCGDHGGELHRPHRGHVRGCSGGRRDGGFRYPDRLPSPRPTPPAPSRCR